MKSAGKRTPGRPQPLFTIADLLAIEAALARGANPALADKVMAVLQGSPRRVPAGEPQPVFTTHKDRAQQFMARATFPLRDPAPPPASVRSAGPVWEEIGPRDLGGRLTCLAVDPVHPDVIYAGSAGGGVWRTGDAGENWSRVWSDRSATLSIGSLVIDPNDPGTLYCGTGEANLTADNYSGAGLFRASVQDLKEDLQWELVAGCDDILRKSSGGSFRFRLGLPRRIGCIAVDPFDSRHILLGGVTHSESENAGLFESRDRGKTWQLAGDRNAEPFFTGASFADNRQVFISPLNYFCHAIAFHPKKKGLVIAAIEARGNMSGIWISRDAGRSWTQAAAGKENNLFGRTSLAVSPDSGTIYALAARQGTRGLLGVFRSDNFGETWEPLDAPTLRAEGQLSYTNCIAVAPGSPQTVIAGSLNLHKSDDGGRNWTRISDFEQRFANPRYVHEDQHAIAIAAGRVYVANDGGFAISRDLGTKWATRTKGMAAGLVYGIQVAPTNPDCLSAGLQDCGIWMQGPLTAFAKSNGNPLLTAFRQLFRGDGGSTAYDPDDETKAYAASVRMEIRKHLDPAGWQRLKTGIPNRESHEIWLAALAIVKSTAGSEPVVFMGSRRLWRSRNGGDTWQAASRIFDGSVISAIQAPSPGRIYVGTQNGGVFRSLDGGKNWSGNLAGPLSPGRMVTGIACATDDPETVIYTTGGISAVSALQAGKRDSGTPPKEVLRHLAGSERVAGELQQVAFSHVYISTDGGDRWFSDTDNLPNVPHNAVVATKATGARIVAHDLGVHLGGGLPGWTDVSGNLPRLRITSLAIHQPSGWVYASTYGRGVWRVRLEELEDFAVRARTESVTL